VIEIIENYDNVPKSVEELKRWEDKMKKLYGLELANIYLGRDHVEEVYPQNLLRAATHGRGLWQLKLDGI
jgi:hypothetical protein